MTKIRMSTQLHPDGATTGQVPTFDGTKWTPQTVSGTSGLLAVVAYNPGTQVNNATTSATFVALDTTNLAVTFTAPPSGQVIVRLSALGSTSNVASSLRWALFSSGTLLAGTQKFATDLTSATTCAANILVTGLTSGTSYTLQWAQTSAGGNSVTTFYGGSGGTAPGGAGQAVMEVWTA